MKLIVNIFLGAYCIALRGYRIMDVPIFGFLEPILNLIFQLTFLRKRIKAKGMTVKEYTNKEILKSKHLPYPQKRAQPLVYFLWKHSFHMT